MNSFSISDLERFSGIKAHTIRTWEQRYNALTPDRSEGNTRSYNGEQLRRLLNIVSLNKSGYKVSELCTMPDEKMFKILNQQLTVPPEEIEGHEYHITQLIAAALNYDELLFEKIFANSILRYGIKDTYTSVIYPVLIRLGLMWSYNDLRPANEHFITGLFRQKILAATDALPPAANNHSWLLFLPENEFHEAGLLMANYMIRKSGHKAIYLGANVNLESLESAVSDIQPDRLLQFLVRNNDPEQELESMRRLDTLFPGTEIYIACGPERGATINNPAKWTIIHSMEELEKILYTA